MARKRRLFFRLLIAVALCGSAYFLWISWLGSPTPREALPPGAYGVVELRDANAVARQLSGTRFAAAFSQSATRAWLERTEVVQAFDAFLAEIRRSSGVSPGRGSAFDLFGAEVAVAWYPPAGGADVAPWVAGARLSARAWVVANALRLGRRLGLGAMSIAREEIAGRVLYSFPESDGQSLHLFLAGRVLVGGSDKNLVAAAALAAGDPRTGVTHEPAFQAIHGALPAQGEIFVWVRDRHPIPGVLPAGDSGGGSVGARLRAGKTIEIDVAAEPVSARPAANAADRAPSPLPGIALLRQDPLFLLTSREPVPTALVDLLQSRRKTVVQRHGGTAAPAPDLQTGGGYAVVITESSRAAGFFPAPRGLVIIGMASAGEAARALPLLFPPGARSVDAGGTPALTTRESFPLAGGFELWGAAHGAQLIFATDNSLIVAANAEADTAASRRPADATWPVDSVVTLSVQKVLPLVQRWAIPLSGFVTARWPEAPDVTRDLDLLAALDSVRVAAGSDGRFERAAITLEAHDLR